MVSVSLLLALAATLTTSLVQGLPVEDSGADATDGTVDLTPVGAAMFTTTDTSQEFINDCLNSHNSYRSGKGIPALKWSLEYANNALAWAKILQQRGRLQHGGVWSNAQNLAWGYLPCSRAVKAWYDEGVTGGHYRNMMNSRYTSLGCAQAGRYIVCNY